MRFIVNTDPKKDERKDADGYPVDPNAYYYPSKKDERGDILAYMYKDPVSGNWMERLREQEDDLDEQYIFMSNTGGYKRLKQWGAIPTPEGNVKYLWQNVDNVKREPEQYGDQGFEMDRSFENAPGNYTIDRGTDVDDYSGIDAIRNSKPLRLKVRKHRG